IDGSDLAAIAGMPKRRAGQERAVAPKAVALAPAGPVSSADTGLAAGTRIVTDDERQLPSGTEPATPYDFRESPLLSRLEPGQSVTTVECPEPPTPVSLLPPGGSPPARPAPVA
ncbi:MAG: hypothetical protein ACYCO3_11235, partial [Mycobacteriales bacterium]